MPALLRPAISLLTAAAFAAACGGDPGTGSPSPGASATDAGTTGAGSADGPTADPSPDGAATGDDRVREEIEVADGRVTGGERRIRTSVGDTLSLTLTSDRADAVHVHGYDQGVELVPGEPVTFEFVTDIPGVFEIELHEAALEVATLEVRG